jgi:predicted DNA-binding transcriptional regulator AlpA
VQTLTSTQHRDAQITAAEHESENKAVWLRIQEAVRTRGIGRSTLYELIAAQKIKSRLVKPRRDSIRGIRLVSADSLDEFIEREGS